MNSIKRNLAWLLVSQGATWLVSIGLLLATPRVLGESSFGEFSFVVVYVSFFDLVAGGGTNTFLIKAIARDVFSVGDYLYNTLALKLLSAIVLGALAIGVAFALDMSHTAMMLVVVGTFGMIVNQVNSTLVAVLTGLQLMPRIARWNIVQIYSGGLSALLVLYLHGSVILYALAIASAGLLPIPAHAYALRKHLRGKRGLDLGLWRKIARGGVPYFVLAALLVVYGTIDIPLLEAMAGSERVAWYALAYRWVSVPAFFASAVSSAFFPAMASEGAKITPEFVSLANRALRLSVFVATPATVGIALIASPFLTLLYGHEYHEAVPVMQILALHIPVVSMDIILGSTAMAADRQRQWVVASVIATLFNPLLNLAAIPFAEHHFSNGALGAATITVFTELILMVGGLLIRPAGVLDRWMMGQVVRIVVASAAMIPAVLVLRSTPLGVQVLAGAVAYAIASLLLRTITVREVRAMLRGLTRRGSGSPSDGVGDAAMGEPQPAG